MLYYNWSCHWVTWPKAFWPQIVEISQIPICESLKIIMCNVHVVHVFCNRRETAFFHSCSVSTWSIEKGTKILEIRMFGEMSMILPTEILLASQKFFLRSFGRSLKVKFLPNLLSDFARSWLSCKIILGGTVQFSFCFTDVVTSFSKITSYSEEILPLQMIQSQNKRYFQDKSFILLT